MSDRFFEDAVEELKHEGLYRELIVLSSPVDSVIMIEGKQYLNFCSNNYLGLATHPDVKKAAAEAIEKWGVGSGASRLICGTCELAEELEARIARFKSAEASIVFPTGYMANVGVISSVVGKQDVVIIDKLNHASIIDGCRLSGATVRVYKHCNMESLEKILKNSLEYRRRLIVTDTVFSMEGDIAPLPQIVSLAKEYDCITMIDEAHSTGVFGDTGAGCAEYFAVAPEIDIQMGTLSKAVGCLGGYVTGTKELIAFLRNKARPFIYSTALPASVYASALKSIDIIENHPEIREHLWENIKYFKSRLDSLNLNTLDSESQIIPIIIGDSEKTIEVAKSLRSRGILTIGIRPPTVKKGTSRLRISLMATHTRDQLDACLEALGETKVVCHGGTADQKVTPWEKSK